MWILYIIIMVIGYNGPIQKYEKNVFSCRRNITNDVIIKTFMRIGNINTINKDAEYLHNKKRLSS